MEQLQKAFEEMKKSNIDVGVLCSYENVVYTSGFDTPLPYGAIHDFGGFPLSFVVLNSRTNSAQLLVCSFYGKEAKRQTFLQDISTFTIFDHFSKTDEILNLHEALKDIVKKEVSSNARIGIEEKVLPSFLYNMLAKEFSGCEVVDFYQSIAQARKIKTEREIQLMRFAARVEDAGQNALLQISRNFAGETEFDAWFKINEAMTEILKVPPHISGELVTGNRVNTVNYPNGPKNRQIKAGDMGLMDISTRVNGYWCDCSNVVVFGKEPNQEQKTYFKYVKDAYEAGFQAIKPGVSFSDIDNAVRQAFEKNGARAIAYTGHLIGCAVNEAPRIVCYEDEIVEENMVLCIEPQQYTGENGQSGARIEKVIRVTRDGAEEINKFEWGIQ